MKVAYYVLAGQIGDLNLYKAEALAHFLNRNLPYYHFEIVRVPPSQWHSFVEYLVMKLWHPDKFLYYYRFSTRVNKAISKIVEVNNSMSSDIKYKPWEEELKFDDLPSQIQEGDNKISSIENEKNTSNSSKSLCNNDNSSKSLPKEEENKNKIINISLNTLQQTIVISTQDLPKSTSNKSSSNVKLNSNSYTNGSINNKHNSSISLFSDDQINSDDESAILSNNKINDEKISSKLKSSEDILNNSQSQSVSEFSLNSDNINMITNNINNNKYSNSNNNISSDNNIESGNSDNIDNSYVKGSQQLSNVAVSNENILNSINTSTIESYYKLPNDVDIYIQELLEELPQFTWKVDGEFIGDCDSFFEYTKNNYGYQIHVDDDLLEEIADEDIKIQKYLRLNIPVVFSTDGKPYFEKIPHLSETSNNVSIDYLKNNAAHYSIKKFRRNLRNTLDDIKYNDYVNKTYYSSDIHSESLGYSELEIDSEDLDELINNEDTSYSDDDNLYEKSNYVRMPIHRYHKYMNDTKNNEEVSGGTTTATNVTENLITPMNSKYTPSTKPQTYINDIKNNKDDKDIRNSEEQIYNETEKNNIKEGDKGSNTNNDNNNNNNNNNNNIEDDPSITNQLNNEEINEQINDEEINEQLSNEEINEQLDNEEISEKINKDTNNITDEINEIKDEITEEISTEDNDIKDQILNNNNNNNNNNNSNNNENNILTKVVSSSNSSKSILRKNISSSKGSLQKLN